MSEDLGQAGLDDHLRRRGLTNPDVLRAMATVPRERFVPPALVHRAHEDIPLPIGLGQTISQPFVVAWMADLAGVRPGARVLDVGTGSGYQAAVLAAMGADVHSIERIPALLEQAANTLTSLGYPVELRLGDGKAGWPERAPFDAIVVAAAAPHVPEALIDQLAVGGRLVLPVGGEDHQELLVLERTPWGAIRRASHGAVAFVPLV